MAGDEKVPDEVILKENALERRDDEEAGSEGLGYQGLTERWGSWTWR